MPHSIPAKEKKEQGSTGSRKPRAGKEERLAQREQLALELAREWNSPGDWFHQHLYVE